ncbi:SpaA isopeptide-forming pilin-related protein [Thomasclavelia ramosa]|uniref:SpaA isopeptide-forming pilin-related protein n=1 Tax=Thomasclavelia ramosa TaxID=1547 RepID=UPI0018A0C719|nr:SpaA isopeptide-forming pilin-related protein [Thomasclavelia ramosa]
MIKKFMIFAVTLLSAVGIISTVSTVDAYSETGSITVALEDGVAGTSTEGVKFELIQVGNVVDGLYEYTEDFSDEKTDLNKVEKADEMEELAIRLNKIANENKITGISDITDNTGKLVFKELKVGIYLLRVTDYNEYEYVEPTLISIPTYDEDVQNSMNFDVTVIPKHTPFKVSVSKQDITDHKELEGAHLQVTDEKGNIVDEWVSGKEPHMIQNLFCNHTYTLTETIAPKNYKVAQSINFTVEESGKIQKVIMYDELMPVKVKTGDNTNTALLFGLSGLSLLGLGLFKFRKRKN